jgi:carboxypeptidase family protein
MMAKTFLASFLALSVLLSIPAHAQTENMGSLRGYVKDEQGGVLPGVTVTATGPQILSPVVGVTDDAGYYRLLNLPPGTANVKVELSGFASYLREGIEVRAGSTFNIDIEMKVATVAETITVRGDSPMIEVLKASTSFTISGELLRSAPVTSRGLYTDSVDMIPGIASRQGVDGSGVRVYYYMGADQFANYTALEGATYGGFANPAAPRTSMSTETVGDTELRTGGAEASTPLTIGVYMNVVAPQGGNVFKGSAGVALQPVAWNSDNSAGGRVSGGISKPEGVRQMDLSFGGPIAQSKAWFFSTFRWAYDTNGISRTPLNVTQLKAVRPDFTPFNNTWRTKNPFVKVTNQLSQNHVLSSFYVYDRAYYTSNLEYDEDPVNYQSGGGSLAQTRLSSVWGSRLTSQLSVAYSNKGNNSEATFAELTLGAGPQVVVHNDIFTSAGIPTGTGVLVRMTNPQTTSLTPSSFFVLQGDVTYFKDGWLGSHEVKTGVWAAPRSHFDQTNRYVNDGFVLQEMRQNDPTNFAAGLTPFHLRYNSPSSLPTIAARDKDIGIYVQDSWKPNARMAISAGLRVDAIRRFDAILGVQRMKSTEIGPRLGVSYMLTKDAKNVVRFFVGRVHNAMAGNDVVESFATTSPVTTRDVYVDRNGVQTTVITPPPTAPLAALQFDKNLHQPHVDEFIVGFRKQFRGQLSLDVSGRRRYYKELFGLVDINGMYPSGPNRPFGGFGLVDPNRGILYQERNNTWSWPVATAIEAVAAKNMSHNVQAMVSFNRQWQHLEGTWNPTDPARFIQPDAFPNNHQLPATTGNTDTNSLDGGASTIPAFAGWRPYALRAAGQYLAPWGLTLAGSYEVSAGDYTAPIVDRIAAADPIFGPARVTLANGTTQANPLATTIRLAFPTRGEGQVLNEATRSLQLKVGREFRYGRNRLMTSLNIYNILNSGSNTQYADGANQLYSPLYLSAYNKLSARAFQLMIVYRF